MFGYRVLLTQWTESRLSHCLRLRNELMSILNIYRFMKRLHLMLCVGFLYLQEVLTQFSKRNGVFWFLTNEYLKRRIGKVDLEKEFSGQPKTRLTKTVSGKLLLLVWKVEYELVLTKKGKVGERVRRHWDVETHSTCTHGLKSHRIWNL